MADKKMPEKKSKMTHKHAPGQVKCEKCDREFNDQDAFEYPGKLYVHQGKVLCEDCLIDMGVSPDGADSYRTYIAAHTDPGLNRTL
jgi:hypothetical protein